VCCRFSFQKLLNVKSLESAEEMEKAMETREKKLAVSTGRFIKKKEEPEDGGKGRKGGRAGGVGRGEGGGRGGRRTRMSWGVGGAAGWATERPLSLMAWEEAKVRTAFLTFSPLYPPIDHPQLTFPPTFDLPRSH